MRNKSRVRGAALSIGNRNGSVRLVGGNGQISAWFKSRFRRGDAAQALILDAHHILLLTGPAEAL